MGKRFTGKITKEWLLQQYVKNGRTISSLAEEIGAHYQTVSKHMRKFGIQKRPLCSKERDSKTPRICRVCGVSKDLTSNYAKITRGNLHRNGWETRCLQCKSEYGKKHYRSDPKIREKIMSDAHNNNLKRFYGIDAEIRQDMLSNQGHGCAVCGKKETTKRLDVDHCHTTGVVRGLLCNRCNTGIGQFKDDPGLLRRAASYLEEN